MTIANEDECGKTFILIRVNIFAFYSKELISPGFQDIERMCEPEDIKLNWEWLSGRQPVSGTLELLHEKIDVSKEMYGRRAHIQFATIWKFGIYLIQEGPLWEQKYTTTKKCKNMFNLTFFLDRFSQLFQHSITFSCPLDWKEFLKKHSSSWNESFEMENHPPEV